MAKRVTMVGAFSASLRFVHLWAYRRRNRSDDRWMRLIN